MRARFTILFLSFFFWVGAFGQKDTVHLDQVLKQVIEYHPMSRVANIQNEMAEAYLMKARGGFDPKLKLDYGGKRLNDKHYYDLFGTSLEAATITGIKVKGGFDQSTGSFVNGMDATGNGGLLYAGVVLPLGRGMFIDERRATLRQAKIAQELAEFERQSLMNNLLLKVTETYWKWSFAFTMMHIYEEAMDLAYTRFEQERERFYGGESSGVDTLESYLQYQSRLAEFNKAQIKFYEKQLMLSAQLWNENGEPVEMGPDMVPVDLLELHPDAESNVVVLDEETFRDNHPVSRRYEREIEMQQVDIRLRKEMIKPQLEVSYNIINEPFYQNDEFVSGLSPNDYKLGVNFSMPILLRKERAALQISNLYLETKQQFRDQKVRELWQEYNATIRNLVLYTNQIANYRLMMRNYNRLLNAEVTMFMEGESTLFMINAREIKYIDSRVKLTENYREVVLMKARLHWLSGDLWDWEPEDG